MDTFTPPAELTLVRDQALQIATTQAALELRRAFRDMSARNFEQTFPESFDSIVTAITRGQRAAIETSTWYLEEAVRTTTGRPIMLADAVEQAGVTARGSSVPAYVRRTPDVIAARVAAGLEPAEALAMSQRQLMSLAQTEPYRLMRQVTARVSSTNGNFAGWRRVPEPGACPFCRMLATRGAAYLSQSSAQATDKRLAYHNRCKCTAVPVVASKVRAVNTAGAAEWATMPRPTVTNSGTRSTGRARGRRAGGPAGPLTNPNTMPGARTAERLDSVKLQIGQIEARLADLEARAAAGDVSATKPLDWCRGRLDELRKEFAELDDFFNPKPVTPAVPKRTRTPKPKPEPAPTPVAAPVTKPASGPVELDLQSMGSSWQDHPATKEWLGGMGGFDFYIERQLADNRVWYNESTRTAVIVHKSFVGNGKNLEDFLQIADDSVDTVRRNLPAHRRDEITIFQFNGKAKGSTNAQTMLGGSRIEVNRNQLALSNPKKAAAKEATGGVKHWSMSERSANPVRYTLIHELGHNADMPRGAKGATFDDWRKRRRDLFKKWRAEGAPDAAQTVVAKLESSTRFTASEMELLAQVNDGPTLYGRTSDTEMFAEAWTAWHSRDVIDLPPLTLQWATEYAKEFGWT